MGNDTLLPPGTYPVQIWIKHPPGLHDYVIELQELPSFAHLWVTYEHTHDPLISVDTSFTLNPLQETTYRLRVRVQGHDGEHDEDSTFFTIAP